jgi:hypothetical protein
LIILRDFMLVNGLCHCTICLLSHKHIMPLNAFTL